MKITFTTESLGAAPTELGKLDSAEDKLSTSARVCYQSQDKAKDDERPFLAGLIRNGHESVIEHESITVWIECSRACSHQIVRHRLVSYSQTSQRYVNYAKDGDSDRSRYRIIVPACFRGAGWQPFTLDTDDFVADNYTPAAASFYQSCINALLGYEDLIDKGIKPEDARFLLPNAMATQIVMTANIRQWRHIFRERVLNPHAQWEIRNVFKTLYDAFHTHADYLLTGFTCEVDD